MDRRKQHISPLAPVWVFSLLVALPDTLSQVGNWIEQRRTAISGSGAVRIILTLGFTGTLPDWLGWLSGLQEQLQPVLEKAFFLTRWPDGNPSVSIPVKCCGRVL